MARPQLPGHGLPSAGTASSLDSAPTPSSRQAARALHHATTFGDVALLRAVPAHTVMRSWGRLLTNSAGDAATYGLSQQVEVIGCFLSHNWLTPRFVKFLVLAFHFNLRAAVATLLTVNFAVLALVGTGVLEPMALADESLRFCPYAKLCATPCFIAVFLFKHDIAHLLGLPGQGLFLDKVCIHQTDVELKAQGVSSLAAFLKHSRSVLVVYNKHYLGRLWTVYELATCLVANPEIDLGIIPVALPPVIAIMCLASYAFVLAQSIGWLLGWTSFAAAMDAAFLSVFGFIAFVLLRRWAVDRHGIKERLRHFRVREAQCAVESDREIVENNISSFMVAQGFVMQGASRGDALDAFDELAQRQLPAAFRSSVGRLGLGYRSACAMCLPMLSSHLDNLAARLHGGEGTLSIALWSMTTFSLSFSVVPNCLALVAELCRRTEHWMSCWRIAGVCMLAIFATNASVGLYMSLVSVASRTGAAVPSVLGVSQALVHAVVTLLVYWPRRSYVKLVPNPVRMSHTCSSTGHTLTMLSEASQKVRECNSHTLDEEQEKASTRATAQTVCDIAEDPTAPPRCRALPALVQSIGTPPAEAGEDAWLAI